MAVISMVGVRTSLSRCRFLKNDRGVDHSHRQKGALAQFSQVIVSASELICSLQNAIALSA
jgi:hypothetical protein